MRLLSFLSILFVCVVSRSQNVDYQSLEIDKSLVENANAVIQLDKTEIELHSSDQMTVTNRSVVTVFRKAGNKAIKNYVAYDPVTKLTDLEVIVYNAFGKQIQKIKKKDFKDVSAVSSISLYEDSRVKYFDYTPISYPYTVDFTYSYQTSNTAFIPQWTPLDHYSVGVVKSEYTLEYPGEIQVRTLENNFEGYRISNLSSNNVIAYEATNIPVAKKETLSPSFNGTKPRLLLGLDKFHLEGVDGQATDWKSMGKWQHDNLLANRDRLTPATVAKIKSLLKGIEDPMEKAKIIYKYVQDNTRYISVQLGIGGWMPITAEEVDRVKYGDCKGLTNYTRALLKSQGIDSNYCVVWAGSDKRDIESDFASMQGNHVILNIPNGDEDVWLECTSQKIPFGFLGSFTDDRNVLVVGTEGGIIKRTPAYIETDNKKTTKAHFSISPKGHLNADVAITSKGIQFDEHVAVDHLSDKKKDKHYKDYYSNINGLKVNEIKLTKNNDAIEYIENLKLEAPSYASIVGNDMLLKINPFDANNFVPDRYRDRKQDFEISRGYLDETEFIIKLPDTYHLTSLPDSTVVETKFGTYTMQAEKYEGDDHALRYKRKLLIKKGRYSKDEYDQYRNFRRSVAKSDNMKIILSK